VSSLNLSQYDLILSSSSGYAKGVATGHDAVHVCYCHTPMRWAWSFENYSTRESFGPAQRFLLPPLIRGLKRWDVGASRQPDHFIANSQVVAQRIERIYGRTPEVIHPPIDIGRFRLSLDRQDFYLVLARLVSYKRIDLAVRACTELGRNLIVIGEGPDRRSLEMIAGPTVQFLGRASDETVEDYVSHCRALLFPGEEDFGMAPLELAAAGKPTIAYRAGGALETIVEDVTGLFFQEQRTEHLVEAMERFERQEWSAVALRRHAKRFSLEVFHERFRSFLRRIGAPVDGLGSFSRPDLMEIDHFDKAQAS
jgi:glycosyltransferase involved in cell wall biosynthesis